MGKALAVGVIAVAVAAVPAGAGMGDVWKTLRRPLHIPRIESGAPCPVSKRLESARVYPVLAREDSNPVLRFNSPARPGAIDYGSPWSGQKVMWVVRANYRGPVLVRGRQVDGPHSLRFEHGQIPQTERRFARARSDGEQRYPSTTRIRSPGCYAYQVDGIGFSRVFVFEARVTGPATADEALAALEARGLPMQASGSFRSLAFDSFVGGLIGRRFENPSGEIVLWQFPTFDAVHRLLITGQGRSVRVSSPGGSGEADIFCLVDPGSDAPCTRVEAPAPHWYRNGTVLALYVGSDPAMLETMEALLGEQFAGV
jgi:hypothetical protein